MRRRPRTRAPPRQLLLSAQPNQLLLLLRVLLPPALRWVAGPRAPRLRRAPGMLSHTPLAVAGVIVLIPVATLLLLLLLLLRLRLKMGGGGGGGGQLRPSSTGGRKTGCCSLRLFIAVSRNRI